MHTTHNVCPVYTSYCCRSEKCYSKYLMDTLSMLLTMCSLEDQGVRLAANETLNKLVKATYLTHITKIQMTAFNEMKKVCANVLGVHVCVYLAHTELQEHRRCVHTYVCDAHMCTHVHNHSSSPLSPQNGNSRSLKVALTLFAALSPHLQAVRCRPTLHSLAPVLINIIKVQGVLYTRAVFCDCTVTLSM